MKRGIVSLMVVALVSSLGLATGLYAQAKTDEKTKLDRIEGTVLSVTKDKSEIMVRQSKGSDVQWTVAYTPDTKFTYRNAASTIDDVKYGRRVVCFGKFGTEKAKMTAVVVDVRSGK